ncbi:YwdI family protein [Bacillus sp. 1P06AnD]|uniref:YwdI family protein n=1 Tax=Bacillus sp. 1P06AnD TaxID=3132208 RepID=UPI0039A39266
MEISSEKILAKMEDLLDKAKSAATQEKQQAYVLGIKTLCELIAEDEQPPKRINVDKQAMPAQQHSQQMPSTETIISKPLSIDDANGSSLLDF